MHKNIKTYILETGLAFSNDWNKRTFGADFFDNRESLRFDQELYVS